MTMPNGWKPSDDTSIKKSADESQVKRKALIISVSEYDDKELQPLEFCENDGEKMYEILKSLGYEIADNNKLIGKVNYITMRKAIIDFFSNKNTKPRDTLLFYFSGHGIPDGSGDTFLSTSEIHSDRPYDNGYSFDDLTKMMYRSNSKRLITILDCCYSGRAKVAKGNEKAVAKTASDALLETFENRKRSGFNLGEGKCLMASSLAHQESVMLKKLGHSFFTYYLLEGLKGGKGKSVDEKGHVTPNLLGEYIDEQIMSLPPDKRPDQRPLIKIETSGKFILAEHPKLAEKPVVDISTIIFEGNKYLYNEDYSKAVEIFGNATKINPKSYVAHAYKGYALLKLKKYDEAIKCYNEALEIDPKEVDALRYKGLCLSNLSKYDEAIKCYNEALEIDPMDSKVWYYKGLCLSNLSKYDEAIKCYNEAIKINPKYSDALRDKGLTLEKLAREVEEEPEPSELEAPDYAERRTAITKQYPANDNIQQYASPSTTISPRTSSATGIISWDKAIDKKVKSSDNQDIGKVQSITREYIQTKEGRVSIKYYFIPKYYFQGYDGDNLWVSLTKDEIKAKFDIEKEPEPGELQTPEYAERRTAITKQYPDFDSNIPQI